MRIEPNGEDKLGWAELAQAAYKAGFNDIGHCYSALAARPKGYTMSETAYYLATGMHDDWKRYGLWPNINTKAAL